DIFEQDNVLAANTVRSYRLGGALSHFADHPQVRHIRQRGMIVAFDVDTQDPQFARRFYRAALQREALIRPLGNTVYLMPPYIVEDADISHLMTAIDGALKEALAP
ncbi:MAG TPA: aminotransferase class III-fold pyridoxal phosphate-dependent enzyme, partial [Rhodocyclaceae bacterium]|nr:aminotransferase class III-fold pyridoxal phosphate-dependent enzyme [Rhodocyclaceae bacterium]